MLIDNRFCRLRRNRKYNTPSQSTLNHVNMGKRKLGALEKVDADL